MFRIKRNLSNSDQNIVRQKHKQEWLLKFTEKSDMNYITNFIFSKLEYQS